MIWEVLICNGELVHGKRKGKAWSVKEKQAPFNIEEYEGDLEDFTDLMSSIFWAPPDSEEEVLLGPKWEWDKIEGFREIDYG